MTVFRETNLAGKKEADFSSGKPAENKGGALTIDGQVCWGRMK